MNAALENEPLDNRTAERLIKQIAKTGTVSFGSHFHQERGADKLDMNDCQNVLRAGAVMRPAEYENAAWRYCIQTARIAVIIEFTTETELFVVTTWRLTR